MAHPTLSLVGAFTRFSLWLKGIYRTVAEMNGELSPEITDVFDRLLAVDIKKSVFGIAAIIRHRREHVFFKPG